MKGLAILTASVIVAVLGTVLALSAIQDIFTPFVFGIFFGLWSAHGLTLIRECWTYKPYNPDPEQDIFKGHIVNKER